MKDHRKAIFVFGSNEAGLHGAGAARFARERKGAQMGVAFGITGNSFAIPTKDKTIRNTLPLPVINGHVREFINFANRYPELEFQVTRIGCGLAGLQDEDIASMFQHAPSNCWFDEKWRPLLGTENHKYWGTF